MSNAKRIAHIGQIDDKMICYWRDKDGLWMIYLPGCGIGGLTHKVEEHEDGTITVSPSILMEGHDKGTRTTRHGFLEKGVWRDC